MLELTTENFPQEVLESDHPTLEYFYSPMGYVPCEMLSPVVDQLDAEWNGSVKVVRINIYDNMPLTIKYLNLSAPVLLLFKGGQPVARVHGYASRENILTRLEPSLQAEN